MRRFLILLFFVLTVCLTQTTEARKLALLVGVDEYEDVPSLTCCVNDMNTLKDALMKIGFLEDDIQVLVTGATARDFPTKKKIERRISEILSSAGPKDLVFLAFSGHGAQEGKTVYFCPPDVDLEDLDGTCVSISKMMKDLANSEACFKWVVVDACRNALTQGKKSIGGNNLQTVPAPPAGIVLFQSCAAGEESWEDKTTGKGYFTKNFVAALSGEADTDYDGRLTLMEVCKWTTEKTKIEVEKAKNKIQRPYFSGSFSDFVLMENLNVPKAQALVEEAQKAIAAQNYALAIEKYDAALALCPNVDSWKCERDLAQEVIRLKPTSLNSFEFKKGISLRPGKKTIAKFIGKETEVVIPGDVTKIGHEAFYGSSSLTSVVIPEGVTEIEENAFSGCSSLTSVFIPESLKTIGAGAFANCPALKQWSISSTHPYFKSVGAGLLTKDGKKIVACLSMAKEYRIPESVKEIGTLAFCGCSSLIYVFIPDSVENIGDGAFAGCPALCEWSISSAHPCFKTDGTGLMTKDGKKLIACLGSAEEYRILEGVTEIEPLAFTGCGSLTSVVIPEGVKKIGGSAFAYCSSLTSVTIPESVVKVGSAAFAECPKLTIYAPAESVAEKYAKESGIPFQAK